MDVTPLIPKGKQLIQRYGDGAFTISGMDYKGSVIIFPEHTLAWKLTGINTLSMAYLDPVINADPAIELLLIGCGMTMAFIPQDIRQHLRARGIAVDTMDTGAACRTYNVLMSEERRVAAALIAV